ncbi:UDP-N-acetylmuramoyl-tripeptide--D-alanyl-D-alanine ligase [Ideonella sp. A 288]|uniref:UDP-N-acetylmuramoyl-tripeptide--D-alanyl-D- alanine ligase n=1 Tax=Ideonella sp. A 288 TaxID=1962181 RepID=UPI000B4C0849|nr:UDP-N-acetylmuramoyl-tripeptide--D-alanyl-D-alanine ligase [Ideonella sp. A 288]
MLMTLAQAAALLPGSTLVGDGATPVLRVHSDSRSLRAGDLFVALRGERFDAHDFLPQARQAGAVAALAERGLAEASLPGLQVSDSLVALQQLAQAWRARFDLPVIAVTGSNGKTTVTQMTAAILRQWHGEAALATAGNFNNHIGLPLTALRLTPAHRVAVFELGMNHPGEIALLARIAQPTVALVNNAQREHQEFMATVEAVARENGAAIAALPADGVAVYPADDAQAGVWQSLAGTRRRLTFAAHGGADVVAESRWVATTEGTDGTDHWALALRTPAGPVDAVLAMPGAHNVHNALAAASAAFAAGAPLTAIVSGLAAFRPVAGRSQLGRWQRGAQSVALVDDSYNANPDSVRAAIDLLAGLPGPHWLVLGDMGEVGDQGPAFHAEVGLHARERGLAHVWTVGSLCAETAAAFGAGARHFDRVEALLAALAQAPECASALVKGSRFMRMERVVAALRGTEAGGHHAA